MTTHRKPRIAIMGEFSSGKSTLCNVLLGARPLLEKVTATQLPPVWLSYGAAPAYVEDLDGTRHPLDLADLASVPLDGTGHIRVFLQSEMLRYCDLIDMPGISDPSMSPEVWERMTHLADGVLWCTHATQAWRQSESGVWDSFPASLRPSSLLLVTRFDKIIGDADRMRVLKRVQSETQGLFAGFYPISLTQAMAAGDDQEKWVASGGYAFTNALFDLIHRLADTDLTDGAFAGDAPDVVADDLLADADQSPVASHFERLREGRDTPVIHVVPRRVAAGGARARRSEATASTVIRFSDHAPAAVDGLRPAVNTSQGQ